MIQSGIYEILNKANGKRYIGSSINFSKRWWLHKRDLLDNKHHSKILQRAWNKYGAESFKFKRLVVCKKTDLLFYEQRFIDCLSPQYNVCKTAGSCIGIKASVEARKKISLGNKGKVRSLEFRIQRSKAMIGNKLGFGRRSCLGRKLSTEHRAKIAASLIGNNRCVGHVHSQETIAKKSLALKGKPWSDKRRAAYWQKAA